jgi:hypothetical protein
VLHVFKEWVSDKNLPLLKRDVESATVGSIKDLMRHSEKDQEFSWLVTYHCTTYQEAVRSKLLILCCNDLSC